MPVAKLKEFLDSHNIKYVTISHSPAYTAQAIAAAAHVSGKELAKTVMVKVDGKMAMAVLPASYQVDLDLMRDAVGATTVEVANEAEFEDGDNIFQMGFVNSLFAMKLLNYVESEFGVVVDNDEMEIENFSSVDNIVNFIQKKKGT